MKIYLPAIALGALALCAEAIDEPKRKCQNFISIAPQKASRGRRSPLFGDWGNSSGESGDGSDTTAQVTTSAGTTAEVTTAEVTTSNPVEETTERGTTPNEETQTTTAVEVATATSGAATETTVTEDEDNAILIVLDETGSMQNLGGNRRGRKVVLEKFGQFTRHLEGSVDGGFADRPVTLVTFNVKAKWNSYSSIKNIPVLTKKDYNPGYQTNLYDTLGCVISKYRSENPNQSVDFYVISDGVHKMKKNERHLVEYEAAGIKNMVEELREDNWNFQFFGATNIKEKEALKKEADKLGFRKAELKVFDFNGKKFAALMKSMLEKITSNVEQTALADCKVAYPCQKGPAGKICRKGRKAAQGQGRCQ